MKLTHGIYIRLGIAFYIVVIIFASAMLIEYFPPEDDTEVEVQMLQSRPAGPSHSLTTVSDTLGQFQRVGTTTNTQYHG